MRSTELGRFLRSRREKVRPCDVGLPRGGRRRVAGLRREEVAVLASIGTSWYTWLEQGREVHPSESVLEAIAEALLLDSEERAHLFLLGGYPDRVSNPGTSAVDGLLRSLLDEVMPMPAMVIDPRNTVLAHNPAARYLIADIEDFSGAERNCAIQTFENPEWAAAFASFPDQQRFMAAKLRAAYAETMDDPEWVPLLNRLHASPAFRRLWDSGDVGRAPGLPKVVENPYVGTLNVAMTTMVAQENQRLRLCVYQPLDAVSRARLETLAAWVADGSIERKRAEVLAHLAGEGRHLRAVGE